MKRNASQSKGVEQSEKAREQVVDKAQQFNGVAESTQSRPLFGAIFNAI